jgi:hypothetical protein
LNEASGRPYTAVFDTSQLNFSMVPGEGFNSFTGSGVNDFDFSIARDIHLNERFTLQLKAESFNLFNHPNFQRNPLDNVQCTTTRRQDSSGNSTNVWDATRSTARNQVQFLSPAFVQTAFRRARFRALLEAAKGRATGIASGPGLRFLQPRT